MELLDEFAARYAAAWCSHDPDKVASFFAKTGTLSVNLGAPARGHTAIAKTARGFMSDFPDLMVTFDRLEERADGTAFHWTLRGTNTGPGGTGNHVCISGCELWRIEHGLIADSRGSFDAADYAAQLKANT